MCSSFAASLKRQINLNYFHFPNRDLPLIYIEENLHGRFKRQFLLSDTSMFLFKVDRYLFTAVQPEGRGLDSGWCHWNFSLTYFLGLTMNMGSTQPLTEMSTGNISWGGKGGLF